MVSVVVTVLHVQKGFSALHIAAKYGNAEMVRLLLERNVDVNSPGKHHLTPLHVAAHYKHPNVAALLLDNNADPHRVAKVNNMLLCLRRYLGGSNCTHFLPHLYTYIFRFLFSCLQLLVRNKTDDVKSIILAHF